MTRLLPSFLVSFCLGGLLSALILSCGLFEPRTPEPPSQSGLDYRPPTDPAIVIANLQSAIDQKNVANYSNCFADPSKVARAFAFIPSPEASAQFSGVFGSWSYSQELSYFQNLVAKSSPTGFSNLLLTSKSSIVTADSVVYSYDYILTFEHTEAGFPKSARGNLQFTLGTDNSNFWIIYRWADFKTGNDFTWSMFKGKFSN